MTSTGSTTWLAGRRAGCPRSAASTTFVPSNAPPVPVERCIDCAIESDCPYSAKKILSGLPG